MSTAVGQSSWITLMIGCRRAAIVGKDNIHGIDAADRLGPDSEASTRPEGATPDRIELRGPFGPPRSSRRWGHPGPPRGFTPLSLGSNLRKTRTRVMPSTPDRIDLRGPYRASSVVSAVSVQPASGGKHLPASAQTSGRIRITPIENGPGAKAPKPFPVRPAGFEPATSASGGTLGGIRFR